MKKLAVFLFFTFLTLCLNAQTTSLNAENDLLDKIEKELKAIISEDKDGMKIVSITPKEGLINDTTYEFSVVVVYNLVSKDQGILYVGFNNGSNENHID